MQRHCVLSAICVLIATLYMTRNFVMVSIPDQHDF